MSVTRITITPALAGLLYKHHGWVTWHFAIAPGHPVMATARQSADDECDALSVLRKGTRVEHLVYHSDDPDEVHCALVLYECACRVLRNHFPPDVPISTLSHALLMQLTSRLAEFLGVHIIDAIAVLA